MTAAVLHAGPEEQNPWESSAWVSAMSDHLPDRKRGKKAVVLLPPFLLHAFAFFSLLVKRLHFLDTVIAQDQGSAVMDLLS